MKNDTVLKDFCLSLRDEMKITLDGYLGSCNQYLVSLNALIDSIDKTAIFLRRFSDSKYYGANNINLSDYVDYHFEVYIHKIHTILEVMKMTINQTYNLQLEERDCSWKNIKDKGISQKINEIMEDYYLYFKPIIDLRHANTHRAKEVNTLSIQYSGYLNLKKMAKKIGIDFSQDLNELLPECIVSYELKEYRKSKILQINKGKEKALEYVDYFSYEIQKEALKRYNYGRLEKIKK